MITKHEKQQIEQCAQAALDEWINGVKVWGVFVSQDDAYLANLLREHIGKAIRPHILVGSVQFERNGLAIKAVHCQRKIKFITDVWENNPLRWL